MSFIQTWKANAVTSTHVNFFYGDTEESGLMYNLYADTLLGLNVVPTEVYDDLTAYYNDASREILHFLSVSSHINMRLKFTMLASSQQYGIPLITSSTSLTSVCT